MRSYYQMSGEEVLQEVNGSLEPLTNEQVREHQEQYGPNELVEGKKKTILQIFLEQYKDFLVIILIIAAVASGFMGDVESAAVILIVITMNAILGTVQTIKAEQSLASLKKLSGPEAKVLRDGAVVQIPSAEVTVGDIVMLEAGDYIPADGRLLECASMKVDESALTGESLGVEKTTTIIKEENVPLGDRVNMVYSGSFVTYGRGSFLVTEIGMETEVGKIAGLLKNTSEKRTPLQVNLDQFGQKLSILILVFCGILFGISILRGDNIGDAFLFAVALAVAAIPEALSSIVTIVLSFGTQKMAKEHAIIRKLQAVEGLGSVSVICSDKTGTLTQNKMTVEDYYVDEKSIPAGAVDLTDSSQSRLMISSILCNDATNADGIEIGDPTETALLNLASGLGMDPEEVRKKYPRESENPFDSDRKLMATKHMLNGIPTMIVKGAVDVLLDRTDLIQLGDEVYEITREDRARIEAQNRKYSEEGLRVLAFAYKVVSDEMELTLQDEDHLIFLGLVAMMDPPREESAAAVAECKRAGIRPIMITGDHKVTAAAIAKRIGILKEESEACEGSQIDRMSDEELKDFVEGISVYARVSLEHKIRIVRAWQEKGNIVSMTGDGVNDAPALKRADVGFAMGSGTDVAKEVGDIVILDDNFKSIESAILYGRTIYNNIQKFIKFQLTINVAAVAICAIAPFLGMEQPLGVTHILWINLIMDGLGALALGSEPALKAYMNEKPKSRTESIVSRKMMGQILVAGTYVTILSLIFLTLPFFKQFFGSEDIHSTAYFSLFVLLAVFNAFNIRSEGVNLFVHMSQNPGFIKVMGMIVIVQIVLTFVGGKMFSCTPMGLTHWGLILLLAVSIIPVDLIRKTIVRVLYPKTQVSIVVEESPVSTASEADQKALEF